ncbi:MAG: transglutaminase domain-containing protein [Bacteroidota bacterium]
MLPYIIKLTLALTLFSLPALAQQDPKDIKFGRVTDEDRQLMVVPTDSAAEAYLLYDLLDMSVRDDPDGNPVLHERHHRRLKLLRESSFGRADIEIYRHRKSEHVMQLRALVHLPTGGTIQLRNKDFLKEDYDADYEVIKFTFPQLVEGAIVEYEYTKVDDYITIPTRYFFQKDIPSRWTEYRAVFPFYFNYISLGNSANHTVNEVGQKNKTYNNKSIAHSDIRWAYADLPAYREQPYMNNFSDYIPQARLQLSRVQYPNQPMQPVFTTWKETVEKMESWPTFGRTYRTKANYNRVWKAAEPLLAGLDTEEQKAKALYNFVAGSISWNGDYTVAAEHTPNKVFEAAEGSSAELSLTLVGLLREAEIEAYPVLVPLRDRGAPLELYPLLAQFDHTMAVAVLDGKPTLLDPNDISRPVGLPRINALNHRAFVANSDNPIWIDVNAPSSTQVVMANVTLDEEGMADVAIQSRLKTYFAFSGRNQLEDLDEDSDMPIVDEIMDGFPETEVVSHEIKDEAATSGPLSINYELKVPMGQAMDDYLYVQPILCPALSKELADVEKRIYPVDFAYPQQHRYITTISIPEGYELEELPESLRMRSEDGSISCVFAAEAKEDRTVSVNFTVKIDRTVYQPAEYGVLRDMFRRIIDLQESTLVLKKAKK